MSLQPCVYRRGVRLISETCHCSHEHYVDRVPLSACHECILRQTPDSPPRVNLFCVHRGESTRNIHCPTCGGKNVHAQVFACAIHGECLQRGHSAGLKSCVTCPDIAARKEDG